MSNSGQFAQCHQNLVKEFLWWSKNFNSLQLLGTKWRTSSTKIWSGGAPIWTGNTQKPFLPRTTVCRLSPQSHFFRTKTQICSLQPQPCFSDVLSKIGFQSLPYKIFFDPNPCQIGLFGAKLINFLWSLLTTINSNSSFRPKQFSQTITEEKPEDLLVSLKWESYDRTHSRHEGTWKQWHGGRGKWDKESPVIWTEISWPLPDDLNRFMDELRQLWWSDITTSVVHWKWWLKKQICHREIKSM